MKVVQVKCPKCGQPILSKVLDQLFYCDNCRTIHSRNGGVDVLTYEVADVRPNTSGQISYFPFWKVWCTFSITDTNVAGGTLYKMSKFMKAGSNTGTLNVFVPASEMEIGMAKQLAMNLTYEPPNFKVRQDFGGRQRMGVTINKKEAEELADFVIVTIEAEKPGVLQSLSYDLKVHEIKLLYLPFMSGAVLTPAW